MEDFRATATVFHSFRLSVPINELLSVHAAASSKTHMQQSYPLLLLLCLAAPYLASPCAPCLPYHFALLTNCTECFPLHCPRGTELQKGLGELICMPPPPACLHQCPGTLVRERHTCTCLLLHETSTGLLLGAVGGPYYAYSFTAR